mmetsp:Transcript_60773/g.143588  ORF Transcript_60773/g.143588 Transcript_60773/m.143588 type:complete len:263 (+) Transcript_60773:318-1106(+)
MGAEGWCRTKVVDTKPILEGVDAYFPPGRLCTIMPPPGAGKTSLLQLVSGETTTGTVSGESRERCTSTLIAGLLLVNGEQAYPDIHHSSHTLHDTTPHHTTPHHITSERPNCVSLRVDSIPSCSLSSCGCCCRVFVVVCLSSLCCVLLPCVCRHRVFLVTVFVSSCVCSHCLLWFCRCVFVRRVFVVVVMFMSPLCFPCRRVFVVGMSCRVFVHRHHIFLVAVFVFVACLFSLCLLFVVGLCSTYSAVSPAMSASVSGRDDS